MGKKNNISPTSKKKAHIQSDFIKELLNIIRDGSIDLFEEVCSTLKK